MKANDKKTFMALLVDIHVGAKKASAYLDMMGDDANREEMKGQLQVLKGMLENVQWDVNQILEMV